MQAEFLSVSDVCKALGLSDTTVKRYIAIGKLKAYRPDKKLLIKKTDFDAFLAEATVIPRVS